MTMDWNKLLRIFMNNEQLIQKLSESRPVRYAARMSVYWFNHAKDKGIDKFTKSDPNATPENSTRLKSFYERFKGELDKGIKDMDNKNKDRW